MPTIDWLAGWLTVLIQSFFYFPGVLRSPNKTDNGEGLQKVVRRKKFASERTVVISWNQISKARRKQKKNSSLNLELVTFVVCICDDDTSTLYVLTHITCGTYGCVESRERFKHALRFDMHSTFPKCFIDQCHRLLFYKQPFCVLPIAIYSEAWNLFMFTTFYYILFKSHWSSNDIPFSSSWIVRMFVSFLVLFGLVALFFSRIA